MTAKDYIFTKHHAQSKILKNINCAGWWILAERVPDLNCEEQDLLLEVVDLEQQVPDLRSGGILPHRFNPW